MLTQFLRNINWVDVIVVFVFLRTIFYSVKSGFVAEGWRFIGTMVAIFFSFHCYAYWAQVLFTRFKLPILKWEFLLFTAFWAIVSFLFWLTAIGVNILFKLEVNHHVIDKYAAGFLGAARGILVCSLTVFAVLLLQNDFFHCQALTSYGYQLLAKAAPNTYLLEFKSLVVKLFEGQQFNQDVFAVLSGHGVNPK